MYTLYTSTGEVFRDSDNKLIAPCESVNDADYISYVSWVNSGNSPAIGSLAPSEKIAEQERQWDLIKNERDRRKLEGGYKVNVSGIDQWFHSDTTSRIQQIALVMMGANLPANLNWKTMSGAFVIMTQTLAMQVFMAAATSDAILFAAAEQKKQSMLALADPRTYNAFTGWPLIYGE